MTFFIRGCPPTKATGWKPVTTVTVSDRGSQRIGDLTGTDTGFGPITAGTGTPTSVLAGQPTIMADGSILVEPDGAGSPEINGLRPGSPGGKVTKTLAGLLFRPKQTSPCNQSISSWSDSYYGIGPAAYAFISYSHWREPSYARYIEPPERNVQIISETRNVTNIVTNNNVINNFGPPVQTVARRTNQNIQQVKLALSPATDPKANYGQTLQGNQLNVVAPPCHPQAASTHAPPVQNRIANPQVEKGWQGVKPQDAEKLKKTIAEQNPAPKDLPKPTPFVNPQIGNKPTGDRNSSPSRIARHTRRSDSRTRRSDSRTRTKTTAQFAETWPDLAEGKCSSGYFAHSTGSRKEARPTKPARSETYRLASGTNRSTDAHELAWTEAITKRKCSGWIAQSAERDSAESQRSEVSDSGPTGITGEPAHSKTNAQATK